MDRKANNKKYSNSCYYIENGQKINKKYWKRTMTGKQTIGNSEQHTHFEFCEETAPWNIRTIVLLTVQVVNEEGRMEEEDCR